MFNTAFVIKRSISVKKVTNTVESLEFLVAQFSGHSRLALPREFTFSTKTNLKKKSLLSYLNETKNLRIHEITCPS